MVHLILCAKPKFSLPKIINRFIVFSIGNFIGKKRKADLPA